MHQGQGMMARNLTKVSDLQTLGCVWQETGILKHGARSEGFAETGGISRQSWNR